MKKKSRWNFEGVFKTIGNCKDVNELVNQLGLDSDDQKLINALTQYINAMGLSGDFKK